jgi:hypothetical protein
MLGNFLVTAQLAATQEGVSSMESVNILAANRIGPGTVYFVPILERKVKIFFAGICYCSGGWLSASHLGGPGSIPGWVM